MKKFNILTFLIFGLYHTTLISMDIDMDDSDIVIYGSRTTNSFLDRSTHKNENEYLPQFILNESTNATMHFVDIKGEMEYELKPTYKINSYEISNRFWFYQCCDNISMIFKWLCCCKTKNR